MNKINNKQNDKNKIKKLNKIHPRNFKWHLKRILVYI